MKLSIITVNLNNRDGLKRTIDSVVSQTFKDFEWIVIDGGSTDGSRELIEEYSYYFAFWVSEPDKGVYCAMNKGVTKAEGDYVLFLNSGDLLYDHLILGKITPEFTADIVYGDAERILGDKSLMTCSYPDQLTLSYFYSTTICHQACFIKRQLLMECPYDESYRLVSDWKFLLIQAINNKSFKHVQLIVCKTPVGGLSSQLSQVVMEREDIISSECPALIKNDVNLHRRVCSHIANLSYGEFLDLCGKYKFMSRLITCILVLMKRLG